MNQFKEYYQGIKTMKKIGATSCQKCLRTNDIENIGDNRHLSFFEMLGNFSFGGYTKRDACTWAMEFISDPKHLGLPLDRLYFTVFTEDDEAAEIWESLGVAPDHISRLGEEDNFWAAGPTGPCGPCSEIYFDQGPEFEGEKPGDDGDRYLEFWNLVFTQYDRQEDGSMPELPHRNIDTGMGLERLAVVVQDVESIFEVDTSRALLDEAAKLASTRYHEDEKKDVSLRVITDHVRSCTFMISDGIMPSNEGRGYVLRRLLRRAARHGRLLGIEGAFLGKLAETVIASSKDGYPELEEKREMILKVLTEEEAKFNRTIDQGLSILAELEETLSAEKKTELSGEDAFKLYDTYGFPLDLTREILAERGFTVDEAGFQKAMQVQRETARKARKATNYMGEAQTAYQQIDPTLTTEFTGYDKLKDEGKITAMVRILPEESGEDATSLTEALAEGDEGTLVTDKTPFYATMGGQQGDTGVISAGDNRFEVRETIHLKGGKVGHTGKVLSGMFRIGESVTLAVDAANRDNTAKNHSGTHLLHEALREVLGNHVNQAGSFVSADRLRFDFTHFAALTPEEIKKVEELVNREIKAGHAVETKVMGIEDAKKAGAKALFGEKYGDEVRVVRMGDFSTELCGGTHVKNTENIGAMKLVSETGISAGVRRIEALTGDALTAYYEAAVQELEELAAQLKTNRADLPQRVAQLQHELRESEKENEKLRAELARNAAATAGEDIREVKGVKLLTTALAKIEMNELRNLGDSLLQKTEGGVAVLASADESQVNLLVMVGKAAEEKGANAGKLIKAIAPLIGGGGGGRPNIAQAGGKNPAGVQAALEKAAEALEEELA